jgi:hypothetical protein
MEWDDFRPKRIVSGGQTGVDRSALLAAQNLGLDHGGFCPAGRRAEDGEIPDRFPMTESDSPSYLVRTRLNVEHSDATLVLGYETHPTGGTLRTCEFATAHDKPYSYYRIDGYEEIGVAKQIRCWWRFLEPECVNVAGPRESKAVGIQAHAMKVILLALQTPANCICGRTTPPFVWEKTKDGDRPVRCSQCGHVSRWSDFA